MSKDAVQSKEPIHSGHFMISNPHEVKQDEDDEDFEVDVVDVDDSMTNVTQNAAIQRVSKTFQDEKPVTFYTFGREKTQSIAIDVSLNQLKKCINVAYMKLTTPKWKDFKGLKLQWKHRIRLNNVIWRAYYMEFRKPDKKKKHCYFTVPDDDTTHTKIEGSVLEGMYWKRRMDGVCAQYKRWRTYNRPVKKTTKSCCRKRESSCTCNDIFLTRPAQSRTPQNLSTFDDYYVDDEFDNEFTNSLFESLDGPFIFPNPKEIGSEQMVNADIMQPCLVSLQPSLDEIMGVDMEMQQHHQHHMMPQHHLNNGGHHDMYRQNNLNINNMQMNYRRPQLGRQSTSASSNPPILTQVSQPLYSRAIYESILPVQGSPQNFPDDLSGRASSAISFGTVTPQPMTLPCMPSQMVTVSTGAMMPSAPSPIMSNIQPLNQFPSHDVLRQRMGMENNPQLLQNQQQQQFWFNSPYMQQLQNDRQRIAIQMLQSPSPASPMTGFSNINNSVQFNASSPFFNLQSPSPNPQSLSNLMNPNIMSPSPNMQNGQNLNVHRYLAPNTLAMQQPQQPTALPGLLSKPNNGIPDYSNEQNSFIKLEPSFHHQQVPQVPESPATGDIYRSLANPASVGPSTSATVPPGPGVTGFPSTANGNGIQQPTSSIYRSASVGDAPVMQAPHQAPPFVPSTSARYARSGKRPHPETSSRSSPNYVQAASTSSSDMMLSDSEANTMPDSKDDVVMHVKRRTMSNRTDVDESLQPEERKRILHLNAEKNRRNALKDGFEMLVSVIPAIEEAGIKPTNAVVLNRAGQHIRSLKSESQSYKLQIIKFKEKIEKADARIAMLQSNLPNTSRAQSSTLNTNMTTQIEQAFERHVRERSREDYRFWLMAHMLKPIIQAYAKTIHNDASSLSEVIATAQAWLTMQWNVTELRPLASKMLVFLATDVNVLKNSAALPEHVRKEINKPI